MPDLQASCTPLLLHSYIYRCHIWKDLTNKKSKLIRFLASHVFLFNKINLLFIKLFSQKAQMENSALSNVVRRTVISNQQRTIQEGLEESSWDMYVETEDGMSHYEDSSMISDAASPIIYVEEDTASSPSNRTKVSPQRRQIWCICIIHTLIGLINGNAHIYIYMYVCCLMCYIYIYIYIY